MTSSCGVVWAVSMMALGVAVVAYEPRRFWLWALLSNKMWLVVLEVTDVPHIQSFSVDCLCVDVRQWAPIVTGGGH